MAMLRPSEIRGMSLEERAKELVKHKADLMRTKIRVKGGLSGSEKDVGRIKEIRRAIARILTIQKELAEIE